MRDDFVSTPKGLRTRTFVGIGVAALSVLALVGGLAASKVSTGLSLVALAFMLGIGAAIVVAPAIAGPFVRVLGSPFRGTMGRLAVGNALRNRRRTALTAAALMIGLALVGAFSTLALSLTDSLDATVDKAVKADFIITTTQLPADAGRGR